MDEFLLNDDKVDIYLYGRAGTAATLDELGRLPVYTPSRAVIPLSIVTDIVETVDTNSIRRVDGRRMVTLSIIPPESIALEQAVEIVRQQLVAHLRAAGSVPASISMEISGASDQLDATRAALSGNYVVAVVIIYLLLVAIFTHWGYPLLIMTTIPLGVAGGIAGLHLLESSYNFDRHLHNGDSLSGRTHRVPAHRPETGSPAFWGEASAKDALTVETLDGLAD